jgi:excisionase family DNA binding protein
MPHFLGTSAQYHRYPTTKERPQMAGNPAPIPDPVKMPLLTIDEVAAVLRMSKTKAYQLAKTDCLPCPVVKVGKSYRIPTASLMRAIRVS